MTTTEQNIARFEKIINEIETIVDCGLKIPAIGTVVSVKEIKSQLTELHSSVKEAIEEAQQIVDFREQIIKEAHDEAEEIVRMRNLEVSKQPIIKDAENAAREILVLANEKAEALIRKADSHEEEVRENLFKYSDIVFGEIEQILHEKKKMVEKNRIDLNNLLSQRLVESNGEQEVQQEAQAM